LAIEEVIKRALVSGLGVDPERIAASDSSTPLLGRGVGIDSMDTLTLVSALEREFEVEIPDDELSLDLFETIGSFADFLRRWIREPADGREGP